MAKEKSKKAKPYVEKTPLDEESLIIQNGLKNTTKGDIICYILMGALFIAIFIPPIFRKVFYVAPILPDRVVFAYINCDGNKFYGSGMDRKTIIRNVKSNYNNSIVTDVTFHYSIEDYEGDFDFGEELKRFEDIQDPDIVIKRENNDVSVILDFATHPNLRSIEELEDYIQPPAPAKVSFTAEDYICSLKGETLLIMPDGEVVGYVDDSDLEHYYEEEGYPDEANK